MKKDDKIWAAVNDAGEDLFLLPRMANRHGLIAGATGTGKTVTARVLAESFSDMGVPVFMADVKGDLAGIMAPGTDSEDMQKRIQRFGLADTGFTYTGYPVALWDIYGEKGMPLRTTVSEMGPLLMARILQLNDLQSDILSVVFRIADDNNLLLIDIKDLKAMLNYVQEHAKEYAEQYGRMSSASIGVILRALVALEGQGGDMFFGETALNISDWMQTYDGKGMINILDSVSLFNTNGKLYSTFLQKTCLIRSNRSSSSSGPEGSGSTSAPRIQGIFLTLCLPSSETASSTLSAPIHRLTRRQSGPPPSPSGRILPLILWRLFRLWGPVKR